MPFAIELKHETDHRTWKRLSVSAPASQGLIADLGQYAAQYASDRQMNASQLAARVVEFDRSNPKEVLSIVHERESDAKANSDAMPAKTETRPGYFRLDAFAVVAPAPTAVPFELKPKGGVFRGMKTQSAAAEYAEKVADFFAQHGASQPVFVVQGPTSTTKMPFEVVDACAGYLILHRTAERLPTDVEAVLEGDAVDRPRGG